MEEGSTRIIRLQQLVKLQGLADEAKIPAKVIILPKISPSFGK